MKRIFHVVALATVLAIGGQAVWAQFFDQDFDKALETYGGGQEVGAQDYDPDFFKALENYNAGDSKSSLEKMKAAADETGLAGYQNGLGLMYEFGGGAPQDYAEAVKWFRLAAEQGHADAQYSLGRMYYGGKGIPQDYVEAVKFYRLAAEQGHASAQSKLAGAYYAGEGVIQDNVYAHMWTNIAASLGIEDAAENRNLVADRMTADDISTAQRLARECVAKNYKGC